MDARGYGSSYSSWGSGGSGNRGSGGFESYGGGYKDSMSGSGGFGGGSHMKRGFSGGSPLSSSGTHADAVIAKINHRLDMLSQFEGGFKGPRGDGFDQYESFDSRTSALPSRDLYRSGGSSFGFGDVRGDSMLLNQQGGSSFGGGIGLGGAGGGFDSPSSGFGVAKMRPNMRESFASGQGGGSGGGGWVGANRRSPRRGGSAGGRGGFGGRRSDPTPLGGGLRGSGSGVQSHGGYSPGGGRGKLPSLLSNRMYPESGGFQGSAAGPHDFPGRHFGGGPRAGRQRGRKRPLNKQARPQGDFQKKRKSPTEGDEPESKMNKKEVEGTETTQAEEPEKADDKAETEPDVTQPTEGGDAAAPKQDEMTKPHGKPNQPQAPEKQPKSRKRRGFLERVMFACSVCKFRSFYKADMEVHLESRFHKEHFKFLSSQLSKPTTDFLEEYLKNKFKKTDERVSQMENHSAAICQMYRDQDLTRELGMEHFMRKVEAAHCSACDVFIPMQPHLIQKHLKSPDHNYNRKGMMEQSKRGCLSVARSILNHKLIGKKLESYLKGENPFVGNQDEQDPEDGMANEAAEVTGQAAAGQAEVKEEAVPGAEAVKEEMEGAEVAPATIKEEPGEEGGNMEQENAEFEGFEVGEDEDEGYIVHNEFEEGGFQDFGEEDEAANVA